MSTIRFDDTSKFVRLQDDQGADAERERSGRARGLSIINKVTGEVVQTDTHKIRLGRMRRRVGAWAQALEGVINDPRYRVVMITLTYKRVDQWRPNHIRDFLLAYRKVLGKGLLAYAWVAELQKRGAVHYHVLLVVKRGAKIPYPDKGGYWLHGLSRVEDARTVYYIVKYTGKEYQKADEFPKGLRIFAVWLSRDAVGAVQYWSYRLSSLAGWLGEIVASVGDFTQWPRRVLGGGWWYCGSRWRSPWVVVLS